MILDLPTTWLQEVDHGVSPNWWRQILHPKKWVILCPTVCQESLDGRIVRCRWRRRVHEQRKVVVTPDGPTGRRAGHELLGVVTEVALEPGSGVCLARKAATGYRP